MCIGELPLHHGQQWFRGPRAPSSTDARSSPWSRPGAVVGPQYLVLSCDVTDVEWQVRWQGEATWHSQVANRWRSPKPSLKRSGLTIEAPQWNKEKDVASHLHCQQPHVGAKVSTLVNGSCHVLHSLHTSLSNRVLIGFMR